MRCISRGGGFLFASGVMSKGHGRGSTEKKIIKEHELWGNGLTLAPACIYKPAGVGENVLPSTLVTKKKWITFSARVEDKSL